MKTNYKYGLWRVYIDSWVYLFSTIILFVLSFYCCAYLNTGNFFSSWILILQSPWIFSIVFILFIINNFYIVYILNNMFHLKIRFTSFKQYLASITRFLIIINTFLFFNIFIIFSIGLQIFFVDFRVAQIEKYKISNLMYFVFLSLRNYILLTCFSFLSLEIRKIFNYMIFILLNGVFVLCLFCTSTFTLYPFENIFSLKFNPAFYVLNTYYASFIHEINFTVAYIIILYIIIIIFYYLSNRRGDDCASNFPK